MFSIFIHPWRKVVEVLIEARTTTGTLIEDIICYVCRVREKSNRFEIGRLVGNILKEVLAGVESQLCG